MFGGTKLELADEQIAQIGSLLYQNSKFLLQAPSEPLSEEKAERTAEVGVLESEEL